MIVDAIYPFMIAGAISFKYLASYVARELMILSRAPCLNFVQIKLIRSPVSYIVLYST